MIRRSAAIIGLLLVLPCTLAAQESGERRLRAITVGETITDSLRTGDPQLDEGEHYHVYLYEGSANESIIITLRSTDFDSYVAIVATGDDEWEAEDDDGGGEPDAELKVTLPATGRYLIIVTSFEGGETGRYRLTVRPGEPTRESMRTGF